MNCTICNKKTKKTIDQLIYFCKECTHYQYFPIEISATFNHFEISTSLENLRRKNAELINEEFSKIFPTQITFVEVGAGAGYLITKFNENSLKSTAIDMDNTFEDDLRKKGIDFIHQKDEEVEDLFGYDCFLSSHFIEHIYNPHKFLGMLKKSEIKYLVIEVPTSEGVIFKISKFLYILGLKSFWDRMFQKESNSPHVQYFSKKSIEKILNANNYLVKKRMNIPLVDKYPNFKRIAATESFAKSLVVSLVLPLFEFVNFLTNKSDVVVYFAELQST